MDNNNNSMDVSNLESGLPPKAHAMTTRSLACLLADKLLKLKETPSTINATPMDCNTDDIKKRTRATVTECAQIRSKEQVNQIPTPKAKCSRNRAMPPPAQTANAIFQEQANHKDELTMESDHTPWMESIAKDDTPSDVAAQVAEPKPQECNKNNELPKMNEEPYQQQEIINENSIKETAEMSSNSTVDDADSTE